ncbi:MAG: serine/threonine-protein kinase, partial [Planctomycetota bacterium]
MRVGPYEIVGEAGRGGRGIVLRARAPDGTAVALKVIQGGSDPESLARFDRERRLLATFGRGEGFVPLLDAGTEKGNPYIVMPFLEGGTLRAVIERGPMSHEQAARLLERLAQAMAIAHQRGIVHRDLKPENILFDRDGTPLIADLGLGKHFRRSTSGASQTIMLSKAGQFR